MKGPLEDVVFQLLGGLRSGMGNLGAKTIPELQTCAEFTRITPAGKIESHPGSGLAQFDSAPNYQG
jgi:IMP dehydrogenase